MSSSYTCSSSQSCMPRPILKRSSSHPNSPTSDDRRDVPAVHFPPSPGLTRTFSAHSPSTYDRSPIVVAPNSCALPERGCPGRTYVLGDGSAPSPCSAKSRYQSVNGHLHPRAFSRRHQQQGAYVDGLDEDEDTSLSIPVAPLPPLIPDTTSSSESDESDSILISPPSESLDFYAIHSRTLHGLVIPQSATTKSRSSTATLAFLPHPPSPPDDKGVRSRRPSPSSRRRSLRDVTVVAGDTAYHEKKARNINSLSKSMSSLGMDDDMGCLGGF